MASDPSVRARPPRVYNTKRADGGFRACVRAHRYGKRGVYHHPADRVVVRVGTMEQKTRDGRGHQSGGCYGVRRTLDPA